MKMYYVYIMCPHFKGYRWVCRYKDNFTALESCNRKREKGIDSFVSERSDIGLSKELGLDWENSGDKH